MDEKLLAQLDRALKGRRRQRVHQLEEREKEAYRKHPVQRGEFDVDPAQLTLPEDWEDDNIWAKWGKK
jgi:hypothetical protein